MNLKMAQQLTRPQQHFGFINVDLVSFAFMTQQHYDMKADHF